MVSLCLRYKLIDTVLQMLTSGVTLSKARWKKLVFKAIDDKIHANWRFDISLFPRLRLYRTVVVEHGWICWWQLSKLFPYLKKACVTMVRLVFGNSILAEFSKVELDREQRVCMQCQSGVVEDIRHFVMHCSCFTYSRNKLLSNISNSLSSDGEMG